jgi:nucleoside-diphosphate-sugar epimerase
MACRPFGIEPPLYRRRVDFFIKDRAFDISKARRLLSYEPQVDLDTGLRLTAEWYRAQNLL